MTSRTGRGWGRAALAMVAVSALACVVAAPAVSAAGAPVMPANARPHGYTLTDMTKAVAPFTTSGNNLGFYPDTPFQILYFQQGVADIVNQVLVATGTGSFTVRPGTSFYVPMQSVDDSPPVVGTFPTTPQAATIYFFDPEQVGGHGFEVVVDGHSTSIGAPYLSGPVTTPPLPNTATHTITLGVFLTPLPTGTHTVRIRGTLDGAAIGATYLVDFGFKALTFEFTYTVEVVPGH